MQMYNYSFREVIVILESILWWKKSFKRNFK
jgi:hypothetical protein